MHVDVLLQLGVLFIHINKKVLTSGTSCSAKSKKTGAKDKVFMCFSVARAWPVNPSPYVRSQEFSGRPSHKARQQVGKGFKLQGWKLILNQANHCQSIDRLMGAVTSLTSSRTCCHPIVIRIVLLYHLIAIFALLFFVRAICND